MISEVNKQIEYQNILEYNQKINGKLLKLISPLQQLYQINYFYYVRYINNKVFFICSDLNYLYQVVKSGLFANVSPIFLEQIAKLELNISRKFIWTGQPPDKVHRMLCDFDIWNGYTIYERTLDGLEIWGFGTSQNNIQIIDLYMNESFILRNFINYFKNKAPDLIDISQPNRLISSNFTIPDTIAIPATSSLFLDKSIKHFYFTEKDYLTRKELACIAGIINFKSAKEIARELGLSNRTVEKHLDNVRKRCDKKTNAELLKTIIQSEAINHLFFNDLVKFIE